MGKLIKRVIIHWTAGNYKANATDKKAYHYIVEDDGKIVKGVYAPVDNINCRDGRYAAHALNHNTGSIGVAIACRKDEFTQPTRKQVEAMCELVATLCRKYDIDIGKNTVLTHAELDPKRKIDINNLPCVAVYGSQNVGEWLRNKVLWYSRR